MVLTLNYLARHLFAQVLCIKHYVENHKLQSSIAGFSKLVNNFLREFV